MKDDYIRPPALAEHLFEAAPGVIRLSVKPLRILVAHRNVVVAEYDLATKYPGTITTWADNEGIGLDVWADEHTLHPGPDRNTPTTIRIHLPDWSLMAEGVRYTLRICAWKED